MELHVIGRHLILMLDVIRQQYECLIWGHLRSMYRGVGMQQGIRAY